MSQTNTGQGGNAAPPQTPLQAAMGAFVEAVHGLVTVKVRTLIGDEALAMIASNKDEVLPPGTQGACTLCNMVDGDVTVCFSSQVGSAEKVQELHDEAVKLGIDTFKANMDLLTKLIRDLRADEGK